MSTMEETYEAYLKLVDCLGALPDVDLNALCVVLLHEPEGPNSWQQPISEVIREG